MSTSWNPCRRASRRLVRVLSGLALAAGLSACGESARLTVAEGTGPDPALPAPTRTLIPTVDIAPAVGWPGGGAPTPVPGFAVTAFATGLDHPRWLEVLPNGDVLVAETNAPERPKDAKGLKGLAMKTVMTVAGAAVPSPDRITLLRDADRPGGAQGRPSIDRAVSERD
jgi:glucose/arabinose dehydrogenase